MPEVEEKRAEAASWNPSHKACVVIPSYGYDPHLEDVVSSVLGQSLPAEKIIVAHSGDSDPTQLFSGEKKVNVIHSDERMFAGAARNLGARDRAEEWLAFVDSDVIVPVDWLERMVHLVSSEKGSAICFSGVGRDENTGYWANCLWWLEFGSIHPYLPERINDGGASAAMIVGRSTFRNLGGFDETWFNAQDTELFLRLENDGGKVIFAPNPSVRHRFKQGIRHCLRRAGQLGTHSARLRKRRHISRGAAVIRWPILSIFLAPARFSLISWRVFSSKGSPKCSFLLHSAGILVALFVWNLRFTQELFCERFSE